MAEELTGLTPGGADATYKWLAHFGAAGALPDDEDPPQPLYKGDGTPTPISMTATKLFVNGVEVVAGLTPAAIRAAMGVTDYADLAAANLELTIGQIYYDLSLETLNTATTAP